MQFLSLFLASFIYLRLLLHYPHVFFVAKIFDCDFGLLLNIFDSTKPNTLDFFFFYLFVLTLILTRIIWKKKKKKERGKEGRE